VREIFISSTFVSWQCAARELLHGGVSPAEIIWHERTAAQASLFTRESDRPITRSPDDPILRVPKRFIEIARRVARHRDSRKWALLYSILWRIVRQNRNLIAIRVDDEVSRLLRMHWEVGTDAHRMKALLRFQRVREDNEEIYVAWYKPDHYVVPLVAPHFTDKFASMRWAIFTPDCCAHWDGKAIRFSAGVDRRLAPQGDELEDLWRTFYRATFNPARLGLKTMRSQMPVRFWGNLPETDTIADAVREAPETVEGFIGRSRKQPS
jgi:uracil-DNA glycosylase